MGAAANTCYSYLMQTPTVSSNPASPNVNPQKLLYSLMIPAVVMPLSGWMFSVALPIMRDSFELSADVAAWIATAFSLPFMILMPVYGRISDGLGKRRLLMGGIAIFVIGSLLAIFASSFALLLIGRVVQGIGVAGLIPLTLALLTETFPADQRGRAMGQWSTVGPLMGVLGPVLAGFIVARWGWQASFVPAALAAVIGIVVVYLVVPGRQGGIQPAFLRSFDWLGVLLLTGTLTGLLFYLSSRPITGVPALQDWRLLLMTLLFLAAFVWQENRQADPFIRLPILRNRSLIIASTCASMRMLLLGGALAFVMPLYLADIVGLNPTQSGFFLMANPAAMVVSVQIGGRLSDKLGSRIIGMIGFSTTALVMFIFSRLAAEAAHWLIIATLLLFGLAMGLMLAALHRAALNNVPEDDLGTSSGVYSMIRFLGSALGAAVGGILLRYYVDETAVSLLNAYQSVFVWFIGVALIGLFFTLFLSANSQ